MGPCIPGLGLTAHPRWHRLQILNEWFNAVIRVGLIPKLTNPNLDSALTPLLWWSVVIWWHVTRAGPHFYTLYCWCSVLFCMWPDGCYLLVLENMIRGYSRALGSTAYNLVAWGD